VVKKEINSTKQKFLTGVIWRKYVFFNLRSAVVKGLSVY